MKVTTEKRETDATLNIELDEEELEKVLDQAYHRVVRKAAVPGFRKGKAPRGIVEQYLGREALIEDGLRNDLEAIMKQAADQEQLKTVGHPEVEIVKLEPVTVKAKVYLYPEVTLGNYNEIRVESQPVDIADDEVDKAILDLRRQKGTWEPVERPAAVEDSVSLDIKAESDGKGVIDQKGFNYPLVEGSNYPLPGFVDQVKGIGKDEERKFELSYPADHEDKRLAGKKYDFTVKALEVKERKLPELNDEFVAGLGQELKTVDELKARVRQNLTGIATDKAKREYEDKVLGKIIEASDIKYPEVMEDEEIDGLLSQQIRQFGYGKGSLDAYLKFVGKTLEEVRADLKPIAAKRITRALVIDRIIKEEKIEVTDAEVEAEIERLAGGAGDKKEDLAKIFRTPSGRESIRKGLLNDKAVAKVVEIAKGEKAQ